MSRRKQHWLWIIGFLAVMLAACSNAGSNSDCNDADCLPAQSEAAAIATPLPSTMGTITLGQTFDQYLAVDTEVTWTLVGSPGPAKLVESNRSVVVAAYAPGDYLLEASWEYDGVPYRAPFTLTIEP